MFSLINASARNLFDILFHVCCVSKKNLMSAYDITDPKQPYDCCVPSKPLPEYCVPQVCVWVGVTLGNRRQNWARVRGQKSLGGEEKSKQELSAINWFEVKWSKHHVPTPVSTMVYFIKKIPMSWISYLIKLIINFLTMIYLSHSYLM